MQRISILILWLLACSIVTNAQPWNDNATSKPRKLPDVINDYRASVSGMREEGNTEYKNGKIVKEVKGYHFDRWVWYWERHLDENGYMVSPLQAMYEWRNWKNRYEGGERKTTDASNWSFRGPDKSEGGYSGIGRINVIAFHPTDTSTFWIGSAGGGAWKTTNNGLSWAAVNDYFPVLGVSDIDFNPLNPKTVYICTGDRDASDTYSVGVLKSTDGGNTWDTTGIKWNITDFDLANCLVINPLDTNVLLLAGNTGIYKSFDAGATWQRVQNGTFKQILYSVADTNVLFATGGTAANQIFRSADGGASWAAVTNFGFNRRIAMAVTQADPRIVKAVVANSSNGLQGVYNSFDTGKNFIQIFDDGVNCETNILANNPKGNVCGGQAWYDLSIAISPLNSDEVIIGGVNTWYSYNGGSNWSIANQWTGNLPGVQIVHADKHYHKYHPLRPTHLFECNDGGVYFTTDPSANIWNDISNGLGITQFYRNAVSGNANFVLGGSQDNGSKKIAGAVYDDLTGGDGMDCQIDYSNPQIFYTSFQYGRISRTTDGGDDFDNISDNIPGQPDGDWITPLIIDPKEPAFIFAGYDKLYLSRDRGDAWEALTTGTFSGKIKRIARANNNTHIYFIANNRVHTSTDYGANWSSVPLPYTATLSDIAIDPKDPDHFWVTFNGYNTVRVAEYSAAGGWKQHNDQLPNMPVNCIAIDPLDDRLYIGTDAGVFVKLPSETGWKPYNTGLPTVEVIDLGINNTAGEIWAATYGRGMWKSRLESPPLSITTVPYAADMISIAPNPNDGQFTIRTANKAVKGQQVMVQITAADGAVVWKNDIRINGDGTATLRTGLPKGLYIVNLRQGDAVFARSKMLVH